MKTRKAIILEILNQHRQHNNTANQVATLEFALQGMQDALLFQLAQDMNIDLEVEVA